MPIKLFREPRELIKNHNGGPKPDKKPTENGQKTDTVSISQFFVSVCVATEKPIETDKILSVFRHKTDKDFVGAHPSLGHYLAGLRSISQLPKIDKLSDSFPRLVATHQPRQL
jgi:hypothetical protein